MQATLPDVQTYGRSSTKQINSGGIILSKVKKKICLSVLFLAVLLSCGIALIFTGTGTTAHAASNTGIQTFTGNEHHYHSWSSYYGKPDPIPTNYSEDFSRNTGIKIYGTTNNGSSSSTNYIKSDSSTICVDFANAAALYFPSDKYRTYYDNSYSFQILSGSTVKWQATYTGSTYSETSKDSNGNDVSTTYYKKVVNVNGKTTTTANTNSSTRRFSPTDFGTNFISLSDGTYNIEINRSYYWGKRVGNPLFFFGPNVYYSSTMTITGTLVVDTTEPTLAMRGYSSGSTISNGAYTKERVMFTASDRNHYRLYYKTPTSSGYNYTSSSSYTSGTTNGWYYVYAEDTMGHRSPEYLFYYDNTAPSGRIYSNGTSVNSGAYISKAFSYSATDNGSGVASIYYKTPVSGVYVPYSSGAVIPANSGDGWYYFYSVDRCGNQSATTRVYLETQAPLVEIYRNNELAYSKTVTDSGSFDTDIYLNPNDTLRISCDTSSGHVTSNYTLDTNITIGSAYSGSNYTITLTSATGITCNFTYHIVRNKPTITIDGKMYSSGSTLHFNSDKTVSFNDDSVIANSGDTGATISSEGNVNLNEHVTYASGNGKTLTTASGTETKYILTLNDRAGGVSRFTVFIDKLAPVGVWKTNGKILENGGYTNKPLSFVISETGVTATYSHNGGEYAAYTSGKTLTADGTYHVVLTDLAGNKSTFTAHIDTLAPTGQLYANNKPVDSGVITNKNIFFSWDGDITATVNGKPYTKNSILSEDSLYNFVLTDFAGNESNYAAIIDTAAPTYNADKLSGAQQLISKWYVASIDGEDFSFETYDEALAFACDKEFVKSVTVLVLDDVANFTQHHLVADGGEVRVGEYWLYKSKANPDSLLYYFDRNVLDEVIAFYAKNNVSSVNYYSLDEDNVYGSPADSMSDNVFTAPNGTTAPVLNGFIFDMADGYQLYAELVGGDGTKVKIEYGTAFDKQVTVGGLYKLTEYDAAGNATEFYGFSDILAPELKVTATVIGSEEPTELVISENKLTGGAAFYYESFAVNQIVDADKWSVLTVENGGKKNCYTYGDELPVLNVGGEYLLTVYDRLGNGYSFTVFIIGNPATLEFKNNADDTEFNLTITLEQKFDTLVSLEIRKDGKLLDGVSTDTLSYAFDRAGTYTVVLRDNFGRIILKEYTFHKAKPNGEFAGVTNGGKTKSDVAFTYDGEKYYADITKDGQAFATDYDGEITFRASDENSGIYAIRLIRLTDEENFTDYLFTMNTLAPVFDLSVSDGSTTNKNITVSWTACDIMSVVFTLNGGEPVTLENGAALTAEGVYTVTATNDLGTQSVKIFTIDKTVDYSVEVGATPTRNVEVTNENVAVFNGETLSVSVMKNDEPYAYAFGDVLSEEGFYTFRLSDDYGNSATFSVTIDKSVSCSANIGNGLIASEDVQIVNGEKLTVTVTKDNQVIDYEFGQPLDEEGSYKVLMKDAYGNEKTLGFRIVKGVKTTLDYTLGDGVSVLKIERGGEEILFEGNVLNFTESGVYTVTAESEGKTYSFVLELDNVAPTLELSGVKDGGVSGKAVTLDNLSEQASVEVYKDGELIPYELGNELTEYGEYRVVVTDEASNQTEYTFTLKHVLNGGAIALIVIGIVVLVGGVAAVLIMRKKGIFGKIKASKSASKSVKKD